MPQTGNCTSTVRYLLHKWVRLPFVWIGDMPRVLISKGWQPVWITLAEMERGDLLFLTEGNSCRISHLMMAIKANTVFHCSSRRGEGCIEDLSHPKDEYASSLVARILKEPRIMLCYIDSRNSKLRKQYDSDFIPLPIPACLQS